MVSMARRLLLLSCQGIQEVAALVGKVFGCDDDHILCGIQVRQVKR
jgi:hypothetical protein